MHLAVNTMPPIGMQNQGIEAYPDNYLSLQDKERVFVHFMLFKEFIILKDGGVQDYVSKLAVLLVNAQGDPDSEAGIAVQVSIRRHV